LDTFSQPFPPQYVYVYVYVYVAVADFPAMETPDWVSGAWRSL